MWTLIEVDFRERRSALFPLVAACTDFDVRVGRLVAGDYVIAREVVVERKTAADFAASVIDARIFRQAQRLARSRLRPMLLVEGPPRAGLHSNAWLGAVLSLGVQWRVPVICCGTADESLLALRLLADQAVRAGRIDLPRAGRRPRRAADRKVFVLQGLPGVGAALARRLLDQFGSIERIVDADEDELRSVDGIGAAKPPRSGRF